MAFSEAEQLKAFKLIESKFFNRNFGMMTKPDYETLLFHIYIEHLLDSNLPFDDYTMSKQLGISQTKIRNLKLRKELQYPRDGFSWENAFVESIKNAHFDDDCKLVKVSIPDINVITELRYFIEKNGWYDEYQLNPKLFQCRLDFFVKLCQKLNDEEIVLEEQAEKRFEELHSKLDTKGKNAINAILSGAWEDGIKSLVLNASKDVIIMVLELLPFGGITAKAIKFLISAIEES